MFASILTDVNHHGALGAYDEVIFGLVIFVPYAIYLVRSWMKGRRIESG